MEARVGLGSGALVLGFALPVYPLTMTFSQDGASLADVPIDIRDKSGKRVLHGFSGGPTMRVRLPAGEYRVSARMNGKTLQQDVSVKPTGNAHLSFYWPQR